MSVALSLNEVHKEIVSAADRGFGGNCGKPSDWIVLSFFKKAVFVDVGLANGSMGSADFDNFLLTLGPDEKYFPDSSVFKKYRGVFSDVVALVRPCIDGVAANISITGLGHVDKRDSHRAWSVIQAGICDGDQLGTRPDVGRGVGVL